MKTKIRNIILAVLSATYGSLHAEKLWYYLDANELGKSGTYYGCFASENKYDNETCKTYFQACANALAKGNIPSLKNGTFGICPLDKLTPENDQYVSDIDSVWGGYHTALFFRADDGSVYAAKATSTSPKIYIPSNPFTEFALTNTIGRSVTLKTVLGYEGQTTVHFTFDATTRPLSVKPTEPGMPLIVNTQTAAEVLEMLNQSHLLDTRAYRLTDPDASGNCQLTFAEAPRVKEMTASGEASFALTIGNATSGFRYQVTTAPSLTEVFIPDPETQLRAQADGFLTLSVPIGKERQRFYRVEVLSDPF